MPLITNSSGSLALATVARQLEAWKARDLETFMSCWRADACIFAFPDQLLAQGEAQIRARYSVRFAEPWHGAQLLHRLVVGRVVVDHERVTRSCSDGPEQVMVIAIYEVDDAGLIASARFADAPV